MKKYFINNIFLLGFTVIISFIFVYYHHLIYKQEEKEGFHQNQNIILLGDSILKNNSYVSIGKSIDDLLREKTKYNVYNYAEDDSMIHSVYRQLNKIPEYLNDSNTTIFLSIGGNDIIHYYIHQDVNLDNFTFLKEKFNEYRNLVKTIQKKLDQTRIVVLDIYYPTDAYFNNYLSIIQEWNSLLYNDSTNEFHSYSLLSIHQSNKESSDFINFIEPSEEGGEKIVNLILKNLDFN
jgi:hypothetical protein